MKVSGGVQPDGPQTFAVDSGKVYVEDRVTGVLRVYNLAGKFVRSITLPTGLAAADLAVKGNVATLLDLEGGLHELKLEASKAVEIRTAKAGSIPASEPDAAALIGVGVSHITFFGDQLVGQIESAGQLVLTNGTSVGQPVGSFIRPGFVSQSGSKLVLKSGAGAVLKTFAVPNQPVQVLLSHRETGFSYYTVVDDRQASDGAWLYDTWIYKFADSGQLVASYTLATQSSYTPWREVAVSNGRVFQLLIGTKRAQVVELTPDDRSRRVTAQSAGTSLNPQQVPVAKAPAKVVEKVITRAEKMSTVSWTFNRKKHGDIKAVKTKDRKWVIQAPQLKSLAAGLKKAKKTSGTTTAYPYAWGGYDTDKTHSAGASWKSFTKALKSKTVYASNVKGERSHPLWVPRTAGVDCSGFVSSVFEVGTKRGTINMIDGKWFKTLPSLRDVKRGDVLNRSGHHVRIVLGWWDADTVQVIESTTTGKYGKVVKNRYSVRGMIDEGYTAARYTHWVRDPTKCVPGIPCAVSVGS